MNESTLNVSIGELMADYTVHVRVTGFRVFKARLWLGIQIMKLAALVAGFGIRIDNSEAHD